MHSIEIKLIKEDSNLGTLVMETCLSVIIHVCRSHVFGDFNMYGFCYVIASGDVTAVISKKPKEKPVEKEKEKEKEKEVKPAKQKRLPPADFKVFLDNM